MPETAWPPPFAIRVSNRAKYARLRVLPGAGLEVVLPRGVDVRLAEKMVEKHKDWVCATMQRICPNAADASAEAAYDLPHEVALHGGKCVLPLVFGAPGVNAPQENAVTLRSSRENAVKALCELQAWVRQYAYDALGKETAALAARHGMTYSSVRFRRQKSRWGSCTARGALSLNTCLVFLPDDLARHVILHELAHTRHMNHGQNFWKILFAMEPNALALDKRLRKAWRHVPPWIWR